MKQIKLNNHIIAKCKPPFIIAEAGINHNGDIKKAFEMIEVAKKIGLNAIKFQTFNADEFINDKSLTYTYTSNGEKITESQYDMFKRCEFSKDDWYKIKEKCDKEKIIFLSTPEDELDLELLLDIGIPAIKVGSDELVNIPLLKKFSKTKLPIILSSGMSTLDELNESIQAIRGSDKYPIILLVTTSEYPTPSSNVNLLKFNTLKKNFPDIPLGFSDHTQGTLASSLAVAMGATVFEKHFTLSHNLPGPDHWFSADPQELEKWSNSIKISHSMLGSNEIKPTDRELINRKEFRRIIVAITDIKKDDVLSISNIGLRRVSGGNGCPPSFYDKFLGNKSKKDYKKGEILCL
jgi:N,N'-diacetyllegionaminate synthase